MPPVLVTDSQTGSRCDQTGLERGVPESGLMVAVQRMLNEQDVARTRSLMVGFRTNGPMRQARTQMCRKSDVSGRTSLMRRGNLDSLDSLTLDSLSRRPPFLGDGVTPHTELAPGGPTRYLDVLFVAAVDQVSRCVGYPGGQTHEALPETSFVCPPSVRCTVRARPPLRWSPRH